MFSPSFNSIEEEEDDDEKEAKAQKVHKGNMDRFLATKKCGYRQSTINEKLKKQERDDICDDIAELFYTSAISFNVVNNPLLAKVIDKIGTYGRGIKPPSYHEMRETLLKRKVEKTMDVIERHKLNWKRTGCSIMSDGWTDQRKRTMNNFLVNSSTGTVFLLSIDTSSISKTTDKIFEMLDDIVEKVGEENVVQVVTDNAANYKAARRLLMEKRKHLFWTPCAAPCIDLMLEDFEKHDLMQKETISKAKLVVSYIYSWGSVVNWMKEFMKGKELVRPSITRFATSYLTLGCLSELKDDLIRFFASEKWKGSSHSKRKKGKEICDVVFDSQRFWPNVDECLKIATPIIKVLRMKDSDEKPAMSFLYKAMTHAKEEIKINLKSIQKRLSVH